MKQASNSTDDVKKGANTSKGAFEALTNSINKQESELSRLKGEYADYVVTNRQGSKEAQDLKNKIEQLNQSLQESKSVLNQAQQETDGLTSALQESGGSTSLIETGLTSLTDKLSSISPASGKVLSAFQSMSGGSIVACAGVASAVAGITLALKTGVEQAQALQDAMSKFSATTGTYGADLERFEGTMREIYTSNFGESLDDVGTAMATIKQQISGISETDMSNLTKGMLTLRDTFGMDFNESLRGTLQLITQFGLTYDEAMDLMVSGAQNGLNYTDELGDNVSEYAGKFAQAGYSAQEYFQLLENGSQGGAYNLDKVNDAINEVTTRLADGTIADSIGIYSSKTQELFKAWQDGGASQKEVIDSIVADIQNCTNEQDKMTMAATAFGTMGEDANTDFIESLTSVGDTFADTTGSMTQAQDTMSNTLTGSLETLKRTFLDAFTPLGQMVLPIITSIVQGITGMVTTVSSSLGEVGSYISNFIGQIGAGIDWSSVLGNFNYVIDLLSGTFEPVISSVQSTFSDFFGTVSDTASNIASNLSPVIQNVSSALANIAQAVLPVLATVIRTIWNIIQPFIPTLGSMIDILGNIFNTAMTYGSMLISFAGTVISTIITLISPIIDFIATVISTISQIIGGIVSTVIEIGSDIFSSVSEVVNGIMDSISGAINTIGSIISTLSSVFSSVFSSISGIVSGVMNGVKSKITGVFNEIQSSWSGLTGFVQGVFNGIAGAVNTLVSQVKGFVNGVIGGINGAIDIINMIPGVSIGHIPMLARGGVLKKGQVGLLEGSGAEAVVPLERNKAWISAVAKDMAKIMPNVTTTNNNGQTINFYQPVETPDQVARTLRLQNRYGLAGA